MFYDKTGKEYRSEQVETVERRKSVSEEVTELSGIEATAASKAAWLISITVSIGGFLFGMQYFSLVCGEVIRLTDV